MLSVSQTAAAMPPNLPARPGTSVTTDLLRRALRTATAAAHGRLDTLFAGRDLGRAEDYRRFLGGTATAVLPLEAMLEQAGVAALLPDWPRRCRGAALRADLAGLGCSAAAPALAQTPTLAPVSTLATRPRIGDAAGMLGMLYVLEGSRLGARLQLRQALGSGDIVVRGNTRFLAHGQEGGLWRDFLAVLAAAPGRTAFRQRAVEAAGAAFALFEAAFADQTGPIVLAAGAVRP